MIESTSQPLLTPVWMGDLPLPNRIVMAPLTRMRAANSGHVPTELQARYYAQRASAGMIIGEGTAISPRDMGGPILPAYGLTSRCATGASSPTPSIGMGAVSSHNSGIPERSRTLIFLEVNCLFLLRTLIRYR